MRDLELSIRFPRKPSEKLADYAENDARMTKAMAVAFAPFGNIKNLRGR